MKKKTRVCGRREKEKEKEKERERERDSFTTSFKI